MEPPSTRPAWGASFQGSIFSGEKVADEVLLIYVCPLTFGIKTTGGIATKIIPHNTVYIFLLPELSFAFVTSVSL